MTEPGITPASAADALAEIHARRDQAVAAALVPGWYWPAVGGLMVAFTAAVESHRPWLVAVGSVAYAIGLAAVVGLLVARHRAQVHKHIIGVRGASVIAGYALVLVALGVGAGFTAEAVGLSWPATVGTAIAGGAMTATGEPLMRYLRRMMTTRPLGGGR
ncbi:hypothetical protein GA0070607_3886 [Micromonospora coriariae]|uniref:Uncharacterized protein n=1 Tax=Micromonospora coriariae TaxID=285665 RepID=A0A1C4WN39_9ACTN|nr:hypothetical protein [Micromonospora coriariae]SCE97602.1 hypothetical protein GA0070607_3886 [Micromonospora coriariae]